MSCWRWSPFLWPCARASRRRRPTSSDIKVPGARSASGAPSCLGRGPLPRHLRRGPMPQPVPLDRVIAVVNDEALTQCELDEQKRIVLAQMRASNVKPPPADMLESQVLERLIIERAMLQFAKENGVRVDDTDGRAHDPAHRAGKQDHAGGAAPRARPRTDSYAKYREDIRREVTIQRLREREVDSKVQVSEAEVDNYLATSPRRRAASRVPALAHPGDRARAGHTRPDRRATPARRRGARPGQERHGLRRGGRGVFRCAGCDPAAAISAGARRHGCPRFSSR